MQVASSPTDGSGGQVMLTLPKIIRFGAGRLKGGAEGGGGGGGGVEVGGGPAVSLGGGGRILQNNMMKNGGPGAPLNRDS